MPMTSTTPRVRPLPTNGHNCRRSFRGHTSISPASRPPVSESSRAVTGSVRCVTSQSPPHRWTPGPLHERAFGTSRPTEGNRPFWGHDRASGPRHPGSAPPLPLAPALARGGYGIGFVKGSRRTSPSLHTFSRFLAHLWLAWQTSAGATSSPCAWGSTWPADSYPKRCSSGTDLGNRCPTGTATTRPSSIPCSPRVEAAGSGPEDRCLLPDLVGLLADGGEVPVEAGPGAARNPGDVLEALSRGPVDERVKCRTCRTSAP